LRLTLPKKITKSEYDWKICLVTRHRKPGCLTAEQRTVDLGYMWNRLRSEQPSQLSQQIPYSVHNVHLQTKVKARLRNQISHHKCTSNYGSVLCITAFFYWSHWYSQI